MGVHSAGQISWLGIIIKSWEANLIVEYQLKDLNPKGFNAKTKRRVIVQG